MKKSGDTPQKTTAITIRAGHILEQTEGKMITSNGIVNPPNQQRKGDQQDQFPFSF
jgi:hypothetical protein